jgi:hypothetical protein
MVRMFAWNEMNFYYSTTLISGKEEKKEREEIREQRFGVLPQRYPAPG